MHKYIVSLLAVELSQFKHLPKEMCYVALEIILKKHNITEIVCHEKIIEDAISVVHKADKLRKS